jgi:hypothetical protein
MSIGNSKKPSQAVRETSPREASREASPREASRGASREAADDLVDPPQGAQHFSGRVQFDDRGNAIWEWSVSTGSFGRDVSAERLRKLENHELSLADDAPTPADRLKANPQGKVKGYNPYDSGRLGRAQTPKKTDLKKLSDWLRLKRQVANKKPDDDE